VPGTVEIDSKHPVGAFAAVPGTGTHFPKKLGYYARRATVPGTVETGSKHLDDAFAAVPGTGTRTRYAALKEE